MSTLPRSSPTLQWLLFTRMGMVALAVSLALTVFFVLHYMLDTPRLRELTLEAELKAVVDALAKRQDPAQWWQYRQYPESYALRVFDHRTADRRRMVTQVNAALLPPVDAERDPTGESDLREGFVALPGPDDRLGEDRWLLTEHVDVGNNSYWIQVGMLGDPDWRWRRVMLEEMRDHVLLPILFIIPPLTLALALSTRRALRPLTLVAAGADALSAALASGRPLAPLPESGLPGEIRSVVAAMNTMLGQLEALFLAQKQFTSDAAHELRTPLAVLRLQASQLAAGPLRDAIAAELDGLANLVNQLLRFAQAEDVMARERHLVDVGAVARAVCEDLAGAAAVRRIALAFDAPPHGVELLGHAALIDIAVRNLLDNAIRHTPAGGTVAVTVNAAGDVAVDDDGPGVPDEQKELIFARFYRADRQRSGSGIGLALVRRIARLHGGDATVEDRPGGGARFLLRLSAAPHGSASATVPATA
ncbi:MAG: HAMP domain-containing sensor histidine kinase [Acetobacteraceae bacterium]|nr:HAMP domain-containing sensor histidine kinase [Acetobacteraceae bacterium]